MSEKVLTAAAKGVSTGLHPLYLPFFAILLLFPYSYLWLLPWQYQLSLLGIIFLCTIVIPAIVLRLLRRAYGRRQRAEDYHQRRTIPYIVTLVSYCGGYYLLSSLRLPHIISIILVVAVAIMLVAAFITVWWDISAYGLAMGAAVAAVVVYSVLCDFYLLWWLALALIGTGIVDSARLILHRHSLAQVLVANGVGFVVALVVAWYV